MKRKCTVCGSLNRSNHHRMVCLKGTKFSRTIKESCSMNLRLPGRFGRNVSEYLQDGVLLYAHGVDISRVELIHNKGGCTFDKGWSKFCKGYNIRKGSVLVFMYLGWSGFKVDIFNGGTGGAAAEYGRYASHSGGTDPCDEERVQRRRVGRPPVLFRVPQEFSHVKLYGLKLSQFTVYNLKGELRRRGLPLIGCKGELIETLARFILAYGEDFLA